MALATTATQLEATAADGYDGVAETDAFEAVQDPATYRGEGPNGEEAPTKFEKAVILQGLVRPEVTSVNPPPYSTEELNHRFTGVPGSSWVEPTFPHPQV